ncbi:hypothetical protein ACFV7Q_26445 [Streptomyces sp. NPDC059851]|uniref:hypothetical protein n=1 Tax=Streptomyces sp. NPDC059851 TaxID=3346971 RepID=UPI003650B9E0
MATLMSEQHLDARVEFHSFAFQESDDSVVPVPFPGDFRWGVFLQEHLHRFDLYSAGHTHTASVTARVWDARPELGEGVWEAQGEVDYESISGDVAVWGPGRSPDLIRLGRPGSWRVRVRSAGRAEVERATELEGTAYGCERYVLDFWPKV